MTEWTTRRTAVAVGVFAAALTLANVVLIVLGRDALDNADGDLLFDVVITIGAVFYVAIGLLIAVRARNVIGWVLAVVGISYGLVTFGNAYSAVGLVTNPGSLPAAEEIATAFGPLVLAAFVALALLLLLFPDGRPPSPRWRPVLWMAIGGEVATYVLILLKVAPIEPVVGTTFPNPFAVESLSGFVGPALVVAGWVTGLGVVGCFAALIQRFRRGDPELRQQIKWLGLVAAVAGSCIVISLASLSACSCDESAVAVVMFTALIFIILLGVPVSIAVALLKYRLYDLDLVVSKALVYGILAALFTLVYVAIVIGVGTVVGDQGNSFLTILTAVAIAVAFQPVRERVRHLANRIVYGKRATPYEVLSEFSDKVASAYAAEDVLPRIAQILVTGTGASSGRVWLRFGEELRPAASWPENGWAPPVAVEDGRPGGFGEGEDGVEVRHLGELLGALSVTMPPSDPMNPSKERLVRDLAAQAGLVLRNVRLIEELRASRRRIVTAQDERAKQLERNPARRRAAAARCARRPAEPREPARPTPRPRDGRDPRQASGGDDRRAREPARPRARDLSAPARRPGPGRRARVAGAQGGAPRRGRGRGDRPLPAGGGGGRVLLLPRGAPEHREVRERDERAGAARRPGRDRLVRGDRRWKGVRPRAHTARDRAPGHEGPPRSARRNVHRGVVTRYRDGGRRGDPRSKLRAPIRRRVVAGRTRAFPNAQDGGSCVDSKRQ